jgi:hypothetical protein
MMLIGAAAPPREVRIGDVVVHEWSYDGLAHTVTLTVPDAMKDWSVHLAF